MPKVGNEKFPYTSKGIAAAKKHAKKIEKKKGKKGGKKKSYA